mmetsp:Transcript_71240/g.231435  ORF Transcript_71240/g.231435 Transcript_71240/m.231435 type:complete len:215 (-) Transcript_71240:384-1028(-)
MQHAHDLAGLLEDGVKFPGSACELPIRHHVGQGQAWGTLHGDQVLSQRPAVALQLQDLEGEGHERVAGQARVLCEDELELLGLRQLLRHPARAPHELQHKVRLSLAHEPDAIVEATTETLELLDPGSWAEPESLKESLSQSRPQGIEWVGAHTQHPALKGAPPIAAAAAGLRRCGGCRGGRGRYEGGRQNSLAAPPPRRAARRRHWASSGSHGC